MNKPLFNPDKPYVVAGKPKFDPSQPFTLAPMLKEPEPPKPPTMEEILNLVRSEIARIPKSEPQIINKIVERVEIKEEKKEDPKIKELEATIQRLEKELKETTRMAKSPIVLPSPGGSGVIGIPPPEPATVGQVLTVNSDKKAQWKTATGGSGASLAGFTVSGDTEDLALMIDDDLSLEKVANVVATMIGQLQP